MEGNNADKYEMMDPDFGRGVLVGAGFGSISEEAYAQLVAELER